MEKEVNTMQSREYLSQLKNLDNRIRDLIKETERWRDIATSTGGVDYSEEKVQTSPNPDRMGDLVGRVVDYQNKCKKEAENYIELRKTIIEQIKSLKGDEKSEMFYSILYGYYVENKNFNKLAVELNYSFRQIKRHYSEALEAFEKRYGDLYLDIEK